MAGQQCRRPVVAQVDTQGPVVHRWDGTESGEGAGREIDDLGLIDFEHCRACRPRQPVGAGVQTGVQTCRIPASAAAVEKSSK